MTTTGGDPAVTSACEPEVVIRIDLRAAAIGQDAVQADAAGPDTLITIQRRVVSASPPRAGDDRRFIDVGRVLIIDDTDVFAKHATIYQDLVTAPTIRRLLCLVVGAPVERAITEPAPGEPAPAEPVIELPSAAGSTNAAVLWVGDPRGAGWRLGMLTTTRLAVGRPDDPDGTAELVELIDTLTGHQVFDRVFSAISELSGSVAAAATLPAVRWSEFQPPAPVGVVRGPQDPPPAPRWWLIAALLALGCALIAMVPPWVIALSVWVVMLAAAALTSYAGRPHGRLSRPAALVATAATLGTAAGGVTAATADFLSRLGIPPVTADAESATLGAVALIATALIWRSDARRAPREQARRMVPEIPAEIGAADYPVTKVKTPCRPEQDPAAAFLAIITAACRTVSAGADDENFLQLNAPEQLALLDGAPELARLVAYAPEAARETIMETMTDDVAGTAIAGNDIVWTASGDRIGIIRLVPVRPGMLRTSELCAAPAKTMIAIDVTGGGDRDGEVLAKWLHDDELDTCVMPPDDGRPIALQLPDATAARALAERTADWLQRRENETAVTFTRPDGSANTLTAAEVKPASDEEADDLATRIANWLMCP